LRNQGRGFGSLKERIEGLTLPLDDAESQARLLALLSELADRTEFLENIVRALREAIEEVGPPHLAEAWSRQIAGRPPSG